MATRAQYAHVVDSDGSSAYFFGGSTSAHFA